MSMNNHILNELRWAVSINSGVGVRIIVVDKTLVFQDEGIRVSGFGGALPWLCLKEDF